MKSNTGTQWTHAFGGASMRGVWQTTLFYECEQGPDDMADNGYQKVRELTFPHKIGGRLNYLGSWNHEPTREEILDAIPDIWREATALSRREVVLAAR